MLLRSQTKRVINTQPRVRIPEPEPITIKEEEKVEEVKVELVQPEVIEQVIEPPKKLKKTKKKTTAS